MQSLKKGLKSGRKFIACLMALVMFFSMLGLGGTGTAWAKTGEGDAADSLEVNILNPDGSTTLVHDYSYGELAALETTNYYATIDALPIGVGTKAQGVEIPTLINDAKQYNSDIKWESGRKLVLYVTDNPMGAYQGNNYYTYDFLDGQNRYYFPKLVETYDPEDGGRENIDLDDAVLVAPMLASSSYQARWATDAILKSTEDPVEMDGTESFRFCMGLTEAEVRDESFSSTNKFARFVYRVDVGPVNGAKLTADKTANEVGEPIEITITNVPTGWYDAIALVKVDDNVMDSDQYAATAEKITINPGVFTAAGTYTLTVEATGFMNSTVIQEITSSVNTFNVTFGSGENGSLAATVDNAAINSGDTVEAGKTVVFTAAAAEGYQVKQWTVDSQAVADNKTNTLTVENLAADIAVTVEFETIPASFYTVTVDSNISGGSVTADPASAAAGGTITVTVTPDAGKQLVAGSLKYTAEGGASYTEITATEGVYSFALPAANVIVTARFEDISSGSVVWDGSVDVTWYNTTDTVFYIDTPAKLAGLAAIVNGLIPEGTVVTGDQGFIEATGKESSLTGSTTAITYSGIDDFKGKTVKLTADLDMGGVCDGTDWSGPNFMPVGGQYMIDTTDENTLLNASFNGVFDGQGHTINNIYCDRYTDLSYDYSQSIGLIGRLGVHDSDAADLRADCPTICNVAVTGYIYGRRSVGGIAGKIGKTNNGGIIENCANFATVQGTDSKGTGGIVGAGWNKGYIKNCYNAGAVTNSFADGTGGISGANEVDIYNCYNVGTITGTTNNTYAIGHDNLSSNPTISNCYWLTESAPGGGYSKSGAKILVTELTAEYMKSDEFLADLNSDGRIWVADTQNINSGYPILRVQTADTSTLVDITKESDPDKLNYVAGQTFDPAGLDIWANYSDNTREKITDYTISKTDPLETTDTSILVSGDYNGTSYSYEFTITVADSALDSIAIQTPPANIRYASGEAFDPTGLVVTATYTSGVTAPLDPAEYTLDPEAGTALTPAHTKITISYTFKEVTKQAEQEIIVSAVPAPVMNAGGVYELSTADHMLWYANRVNTGLNKDIEGKLMQDIDLSAVAWAPIGNSNNKYAGTIDGSGNEIILALDGGSAPNQGLIGYAAGATIKNLTVSGSVTTTGAYAAGFVGRAEGVTIQNCTNKATINSRGYTAGLLGYSTLNTVTLTDNINEGAITTVVNSIKNHNLGGIAAYISGGSDHVIRNCTNKGTVTGAGTAGGILGRIDASAAITDCVNESEAAVSVIGGTVGGIAGNVNNAQNTITGSHNKAAITSDGSSNMGGIIGKTVQTGSLLECSNTGAVSGGANNVGGIVGNSSAVHNLSLCCNTGDIGGTYNIGGITGNSKAIIADCYNTGRISASAGSANQGAGGIAGTHATSSITNCYSTGTVTGTGNGPAGAMVGRLTSSSTLNCYYLAGAADTGVGNGTDETISKTDTEMKESGFVDLIGAAYIAQTGSYPILAWQAAAAPETYRVTVDNEISGGSVTADPTSAAAGETITLTVTPDEGKQLVAGSLQYTADGGTSYTEITATDGVYSFVLPAADVTVTAQFEDKTQPGDKTPPVLTPDTTDNTVGRAVEITFTDDAAWRTAISGISINGVPLTGEQYTVSPGSINIAAGIFNSAGDHTVIVTAAGYNNAEVTQGIQGIQEIQDAQNPCYLITPREDENYDISENQDGIKSMTVKSGVTGLKYFQADVTPVRSHNGDETLVFVHLRNGQQHSLNTSRGDFDLIDSSGAGFNVDADDIVKVYMVDRLTNDIDSNPVIFQ